MKKFLLFSVLLAFFFSASYSILTRSESESLVEKEATDKKNVISITKGNPSKKSKAIEQGTLVTRVVDGDTIEIESGQKVRYIGVDTPETSDPRTSVQCFGREASSRNKQLVEGKKVRLEKDVSETDKYGRLLRYVYVGDVFVNEVLVKEGYAFSSTYPPDIKYQDLFNQAEKEAREANSGLWGSCDLVAGAKTTVPATDCLIKGNISSTGEKIYHLPGQKYYSQTVISESKGERWFCSEQEAQSAGWRKSKV